MSYRTLTFKTLGKSGFPMTPVMERLQTFGLSKYHSYKYHNAVRNWISSCGLEWAVKHLKEIKAVVMAVLRSQDHPGYWIAVNSFGYPKVFHFLSSYPVKTQLRVINFYKAIVFDQTTKQQVDKFMSAATRDPVNSEYEAQAYHYIQLSSLLELTKRLFMNKARRPSYADAPLLSFDEKSVKTMPSPSGEVHPRTGRNFLYSIKEFMLLAQCSYLFQPSLGRKVSLDRFPNITEPFSWLGIQRYDRFQLEEDFGFPQELIPYREEFIVGSLGFTQEGGGKLRVFANPSIIIQNALVPLYNELRMITGEYIYDYSLNQSLGHDKVASMLSDAKDVFYYDLTNATDCFPLSLQLRMLEWMGCCPDQISLFQFASTQTWTSPWGKMKWTVGQPLGLKPSFHSFSLCHSALIEGIFASLYPGQKDFPFAVVGDDVVICNLAVAKIYEDLMNGLGIQLSSDKHSSGTSYVEFCGRIIHHGSLYMVGKTKKLTSASMLSLMNHYGPSFGKELSRFLDSQFQIVNSRSFADALIKLPEPFGGGHGQGVKLSERFSDESIQLWLRYLTQSFESVDLSKENWSSPGLNMLHQVSELFSDIPVANVVLTKPRFIFDYDSSVIDIETTTPRRRIFMSFPDTPSQFSLDSASFKYLLSIYNGIVRNPMLVNSRIEKILRRIRKNA